MTNIRNWEVHSRKVLLSILKERTRNLIGDILALEDEENRELDAYELMNETLISLTRDLDIFKVQRVRYRHDIIFRGNSKIDIPD
jgi:hypothetical protein